ncbi:ABC transporter substrate-binding protein [Microbacterium sp. Leaf320]|uniref:ABC transporter substrate-binding protein n=1 Tax=Microbacterium sp. Leaf320 TaxID=1736334 RepID=UPI001F2A0498|nr:sugar ABC transporter substrate-binding protein [Microbacterium sp. Leaf320]
MDLVAEAFNDSQEDIEVVFESVPSGPDGYAKLSTAIGAGNAPDVATVEYFALPEFVTSDRLTPLDGYVSEKTMDTFNEASRNLVQLGGDTWALPYDAPPMMVWYRQDLLAAAGVDVPTTWAEFEEAGDKVLAATGSYLASFNANESSWFAGLAWQNGGQWFESGDESWKVGIDDKASQEVAALWQRMLANGSVKAVPSFTDEWTADMVDGRAAGVIGASWSASSIYNRVKDAGQEGKWIAAELPSWGTDIAPLYGGSTFAVPKGSKNPEAAAKFMEFLTTDPLAIEARGDSGSAFLAAPELTEAAKEAYATSDFFGNDIWEVFEKASAGDPNGWQWGPNFGVTSSAMQETLTAVGPEGDLVSDFDTVQQKTIDGLKQTGLSVK